MSSELSPHLRIPEPYLLFHPDRPGDRDTHPLRGLLKHGPYSSGLIQDPIRVATIAPATEGEPLYKFMRELRSRYSPKERKDYLPEWPGFERVFGVGVAAAGGKCHKELEKDLEDKILESKAPHRVLSAALGKTIQELLSYRSEFDVLFIYLPARWRTAFTGHVEEDFDLHDHLKATTAIHRLPIQIVREDKALAYPNRASVMWRIGIALYAKVGGIPWKLADFDPETAYIGISFAIRPQEARGRRFVTCCSQVFDSGGTGLEFVAYDAQEVEVYGDNPFLSRTEMFRVMTRSVELYRRRHAGRSPRRLIAHKSTEFKPDEIEGCMEAFHLCEEVDLVQVVQSVGWRGIRIEEGRGQSNKGRPAAFPVERGTLLNLTARDALLWVHGNVSGISPGKSYFKGSRSTPSPIKLVRFAGHGSWDKSAGSVLALSKMNWNNDSLYDNMPVTMAYAKVLARVIKRMDVLGVSPYEFRFFM